MKNSTTLIIAILIAVTLLSGCNTYTTQTTSGRDYLPKYPAQLGSESASEIDREVRAVANVEPNLRFPSRIGLVKLHNGRISNLSAEEIEGWSAAKERLGVEFGDFIPVSSLIAESVYSTPQTHDRQSHARELIRKVRLASARQHLDVTLIYEVFSSSKQTTLSTSVADWTIVGAYFVPSKAIETTGYANALLMDVRTGYPYGTASANLSADDLASTFDKRDRLRNLRERNQIETALQLVPEVESMMQDLMKELADNEAEKRSLESVAMANP